MDAALPEALHSMCWKWMNPGDKDGCMLQKKMLLRFGNVRHILGNCQLHYMWLNKNVGVAFLFRSNLLSYQQFSHIPLLNSIRHRFSVCCVDGPSSSLSRRITGLKWSIWFKTFGNSLVKINPHFFKVNMHKCMWTNPCTQSILGYFMLLTKGLFHFF